jgi:hypothetical protein
MLEQELEAKTARMNTGSRFSKPVFVVGVFRSGTSLLYALLNQHPQMALMYECDAWDFPEALSKMRFKRDWLERQEFFNKALSRHRLTFGGSLRGLENIHAPEDLYRTFSDGKGPALFGEKSPYYCTRLRQLVRRHPGCCFVLIWRDPVEIYRSMLRAASQEPFFQRRGILSRLIYYQEQMIQQAGELERAGIRLCHVTYDGLTKDTENICRSICQFLGIEFDAKMLDLANADLSAVYPGPQHDHLRHGRIERQRFAETGEIIEPPVLNRLQRFGARWRRLQSQWLGSQASAATGPEPSAGELFCCRMKGSFFCAGDGLKRALFEFLPLPWLRTYRQTKKWFLSRDAELSAGRPSLLAQFLANKITVLLSYAILAGVAVLDFVSGPDLTLAPFYMIPPAVLALIVGRRWGSITAAAAVITWSVLQGVGNAQFMGYGVILWNSTMRFVVFQVIVLLLDRVRVESAFASKADA